MEFEDVQLLIDKASKDLGGAEGIGLLRDETKESGKYGLSFNDVCCLECDTPDELLMAILEEGILRFAKLNQNGEE